MCQKYGKIAKIILDHKWFNAIFVKFEHKSDAKHAFEDLNIKFFDKRPLICGYFEKEIFY